MQEKPTTVAAYAAGASLAAVALFYVFGPNYTIDADDFANSSSSKSSSHRKKSIVGLANPANDCFINSVLQALAGLGDLRIYLIHELHRRRLDGPEIYAELLPVQEEEEEDNNHVLPFSHGGNRGDGMDRIRELQQGTITRALKEMLDRLNERPIYKKTISAAPFLHSLESAYRMRISRSQQDAQEFLQIVAERLCEEYHAGVKLRKRVNRSLEAAAAEEDEGEGGGSGGADDSPRLIEMDQAYGFPFEGKLESQIECQFCHYQYKPNSTSFVNLTLQVPQQKSSTTLNACFDGLLKTEYIDDFRCDNCLLNDAIQKKRLAISRARSTTDRQRLEEEVNRIQTALDDDPEYPPDGVTLPPADQAPRRRIARHMRITVFPKVVAIHLSRSIFDQSSSTKNAAKVAFPERLPLGGILDQKWFKLLAIVCHKGSHQSGHYESFRRNTLYPPFATPDPFGSYAQSRATSANPSRAPSPLLSARTGVDSDVDTIQLSRSGSTTSLSTHHHHPLPPLAPHVQQQQQHPGPPSLKEKDQFLSLSSASSSRPNTPHSSSQSRVSFQSPKTAATTTSRASGGGGGPPHTLSPTSTAPTSASPSPSTFPSTAPRPVTSTDDHWSSSSSSNRSNTRRPYTAQGVSTSASGGGGGGGSPSVASAASAAAAATAEKGLKLGRRRQDKINNRWWRISDEKIKECKTSDVLGMQKDVYLLFYEQER